MSPDLVFDPQNVFYRCVEDSNEAIMVSNTRGILVYVNPAWSRIYGFSREEALGNTPKLLHSGLQPEAFYKEMWSAILNPAIGHWKGELVNKAKDGSLVPVLLTITPYRDKDLRIAGYMGLALDMTAKRELEAKIAHQDRLASIGMLASGLAHEVGTPLGVVRGRAELLLMRLSDPSNKKDLEIITAQIDRISKLIRSLLRISRSFSDVHIEEISPLDVVNEVIALVGQHFREDQVEVKIEVPPGKIVRADYGRLEQVVLNLIMNSIHAIRKAVANGRPRGHFVLIQLTPPSNGKVRLKIEDSGCGISSENMKKLFKPFFTTKDVGEGTGLGLAIVAQLVREMNGEIAVHSRVDQGTAFSITLDSVI